MNNIPVTDNMILPDAPATHRNRQPILKWLSGYLSEPSTVLEIGSGTGQHAAYFAEHLPHVTWIPTEQAINLSGLEAWRQYSGCINIAQPQLLDVSQPWPNVHADHLFSANTVHIMPLETVKMLFLEAGRLLPSDGLFFLYGPFRYGGQYTSASNEAFDQQLKQRASHQGIRDIEQLAIWAESASLTLTADHPMPTNNQLLVFRCIP
ncbi:MAG: DUF938 domain-containing protein [Endozoicomonadaceae bacterium]|nr:DUF938 domain-containing protein [Endozoicomonadaceae bacterium]